MEQVTTVTKLVESNILKKTRTIPVIYKVVDGHSVYVYDGNVHQPLDMIWTEADGNITFYDANGHVVLVGDTADDEYLFRVTQQTN